MNAFVTSYAILTGPLLATASPISSSEPWRRGKTNNYSSINYGCLISTQFVDCMFSVPHV